MADDAIQPNSSPPNVPVSVNGPVPVAPAAQVVPTTPPTEPTLSPVGQVKQFLWPQNTGYAPQVESGREVVETIVFVVVLVLLLKSFAAEAFVIPTGSMAETLWGYQKVVVCPECQFQFPVNVSSEVEPSREQLGVRITGCVCPNCRLDIRFSEGEVARSWNSGDRVLVAKSLYESGLMMPERFDVVVFKFPGNPGDRSDGPQKDHVPMNYIKRLIGLPGETVGIHYGNLYMMRGVQPTEEDLKEPLEQWRPERMHVDQFRSALEKVTDRERFEIIRKPPEKILAMRRIVYDNDHPARDLEGKVPPRWTGRKLDGPWTADNARGFKHVAQGEEIAWLDYRHLLRTGREDRPQLITDFMGYNAYDSTIHAASQTGQNWVGDLILDFDVRVESASGGELVVELARGVDRFRARFDLTTGACELFRVLPDNKEESLGDKAMTAVKGTGGWHIRLANVDNRLTLWVDGRLPFGDGRSYDEPKSLGPTRHDLRPASIGVKGATVQVSGLKLWRDTYYTVNPGGADASPPHPDWDNPETWETLRELPARTLFVQPGHYLCLGDNSPESSDSRYWGLVPERLMLGRALLVYYPFYAPFWPLNTPVNRVGIIR